MNTPIDHKPAKCVGCLKLSKPRPVGDVPPGWMKEYGGRYWCSGCKKAPDA